MLPLAETVHELLEKTVVYKTYTIKEKKMMTVSNKAVERCLAPIWC